MRFSIGDRVISDRVRGHVGRVVRVKKLRGLCLVTWSKNISTWLDGEDLQPAPLSTAAVPVTLKGGWFNSRAYRKLALDMVTADDRK